MSLFARRISCLESSYVYSMNGFTSCTGPIRTTSALFQLAQKMLEHVFSAILPVLFHSVLNIDSCLRLADQMRMELNTAVQGRTDTFAKVDRILGMSNKLSKMLQYNVDLFCKHYTNPESNLMPGMPGNVPSIPSRNQSLSQLSMMQAANGQRSLADVVRENSFNPPAPRRLSTGQSYTYARHNTVSSFHSPVQQMPNHFSGQDFCWTQNSDPASSQPHYGQPLPWTHSRAYPHNATTPPSNEHMNFSAAAHNGARNSMFLNKTNSFISRQ
ncbi:hypothetical protein Ciccas_003681 [Cichlidogyrus casuarinus]|uniref:Uncharacterized protein n=1 Tax=Cichlidogyrus casuarinus TaxID=1844966 RepID=A0ABD2QDV1_9PLAT